VRLGDRIAHWLHTSSTKVAVGYSNWRLQPPKIGSSNWGRGVNYESSEACSECQLWQVDVEREQVRHSTEQWGEPQGSSVASPQGQDVACRVQWRGAEEGRGAVMKSRNRKRAAKQLVWGIFRRYKRLHTIIEKMNPRKGQK